MHPEERQRVTGNSGTVETLRGKQETEDGEMSRQYQRMNGGNRRRCKENKGLRTEKRKRGIPEGQAGHEGASRDEAVPRAAKDPNTEVGMTVRSTAREHNKQGRNEEHVMGSPTLKPTILDVSWNASACNQPNLL